MRPIFAVCLILLPVVSAAAPKTTLLSDDRLAAIVAEASGSLAKDTVVALCEHHRVQATSGFHEAAEYVAARARAYGLEEVKIETFPADGASVYGTFKAYLGWEADSAVLDEVAPRAERVADYAKMRVALADYSNDADVTADLVDVGQGTADADYAGKDVRGKIALTEERVEPAPPVSRQDVAWAAIEAIKLGISRKIVGFVGGGVPIEQALRA